MLYLSKGINNIDFSKDYKYSDNLTLSIISNTEETNKNVLLTIIKNTERYVRTEIELVILSDEDLHNSKVNLKKGRYNYFLKHNEELICNGILEVVSDVEEIEQYNNQENKYVYEQ